MKSPESLLEPALLGNLALFEDTAQEINTDFVSMRVWDDQPVLSSEHEHVTATCIGAVTP